jgi:hypothetical protein
MARHDHPNCGGGETRCMILFVFLHLSAGRTRSIGLETGSAALGKGKVHVRRAGLN